MKNTVKFFIAVSVCLLAIATIVAGTYAFYVSEDQLENRMKMAICSSKIVEEFDGTEKSVVITNTGTSPLIVRANAEMVCTNEEITLNPEKIAKAEYNNLLEEEYPADKWIYGNDGWYYYTKILRPNEATSELIHIKILPEDEWELSKEERTVYDGANIDVPVQLEYHYPHIVNGEYPHEDSWNITDSNIKEMLRSFANSI